jgi:hypothetical protein
MAEEVVKIQFKANEDPVKLYPMHRYLRQAVHDSGKSIGELMSDPFDGYPYLLRALLTPGKDRLAKQLTLDDCSDRIDDYRKTHKGLEGLTEALVKVLALYLHIETKPREEERTGDGDERPLQDGPVETAPSEG